MPQANYDPYVVPNGGTQEQMNINYRVDKAAGKMQIFLGIYRSGLEEFLAYEVSVSTGTTTLDGTTLLPETAYTIPSTVSCPDGKRDATFYLSVNIEYLQDNPTTDFSLPVTISNPTRYSLHESLITTSVRINTSELISEEAL
jgi:hypothetical protein